MWRTSELYQSGAVRVSPLDPRLLPVATLEALGGRRLNSIRAIDPKGVAAVRAANADRFLKKALRSSAGELDDQRTQKRSADVEERHVRALATSLLRQRKEPRVRPSTAPVTRTDIPSRPAWRCGTGKATPPIVNWSAAQKVHEGHRGSLRSSRPASAPVIRNRGMGARYENLTNEKQMLESQLHELDEKLRRTSIRAGRGSGGYGSEDTDRMSFVHLTLSARRHIFSPFA